MKFTDEEIQKIKDFSNELYNGSDLYKKVITNVCLLTGNDISELLKKNKTVTNVYCRSLISYALYKKGISKCAIAKLLGFTERVVGINIKKIEMEMDIDEHVNNQVKSLLRSL